MNLGLMGLHFGIQCPLLGSIPLEWERIMMHADAFHSANAVLLFSESPWWLSMLQATCIVWHPCLLLQSWMPHWRQLHPCVGELWRQMASQYRVGTVSHEGEGEPWCWSVECGSRALYVSPGPGVEMDKLHIYSLSEISWIQLKDYWIFSTKQSKEKEQPDGDILVHGVCLLAIVPFGQAIDHWRMTFLK